MSEKLRQGLASLAEQATPVDLSDRVRRGSRRITIRNRTIGAVAVTVLVAVVGLGMSLLPRPRPTIVTPTPTPTSTPMVDFRNATFTVPAFPDYWNVPCPAGQRTFVDGWVHLSAGTALSVWDGTVRGDLDGAPGDEYVVRISCDTEPPSAPIPLAVRVSPDGQISPLGWVPLTPDGRLLVTDDNEPLEIVDGAVYVHVVRLSENAWSDKQRRGYSYRDGQMRQVAGPTSFVPPVTDPSAYDFRNTTLVLLGWVDLSGLPRGYDGFVRMVDGTGHAHVRPWIDTHLGEPVGITVTVRSTISITASSDPMPIALFDVRADDGTLSQMVMSASSADAQLLGQLTVTMAGPGEFFTRIAADGPNRLRVELTAGGRPTTRYYAYSGAAGWRVE